MLTPVGLLLALTMFGTIGFRFTTDSSWLDSIYLAVVTLTTVGSRDAATGTASTIFVIVYLVSGLGIFTFSAFEFGSWIVRTEFHKVLEKRRMQNRINGLENHSIICGQGRMGLAICEYLAERGRSIVVIDQDEDRISPVCQLHGWSFVIGDATDDDVLKSAGIDRAASLTTVLATDADNLYIVLSARILNPNIKIIARAVDEKAVEKLERAGATRVVSPFRTGAVKMARFMLNPSIEDFIEIADSRGNELELADIQISADSTFVGRQLMETDLRNRGVMVIGIRRSNGERLMPPPGNAVIRAGDSLFVFGNADAVNSVLDRSENAAENTSRG
ncbi:MAG: potassium channel protein [Planctomycetota bacterium]|nr:potassium channel protein [Planctomycetota bacterium]MDA1165842.1 potassium channel protein [Planctomycetota bacterium]